MAAVALLSRLAICSTQCVALPSMWGGWYPKTEKVVTNLKINQACPVLPEVWADLQEPLLQGC